MIELPDIGEMTTLLADVCACGLVGDYSEPCAAWRVPIKSLHLKLMLERSRRNWLPNARE